MTGVRAAHVGGHGPPVVVIVFPFFSYKTIIESQKPQLAAAQTRPSCTCVRGVPGSREFVGVRELAGTEEDSASPAKFSNNAGLVAGSMLLISALLRLKQQGWDK